FMCAVFLNKKVNMGQKKRQLCCVLKDDVRWPQYTAAATAITLPAMQCLHVQAGTPNVCRSAHSSHTGHGCNRSVRCFEVMKLEQVSFIPVWACCSRWSPCHCGPLLSAVRPGTT